MWCFAKMLDVGSGYLGNPTVETVGFKMIDVSRASILSTKFHTGNIFFNPIITVKCTTVNSIKSSKPAQKPRCANSQNSLLRSVTTVVRILLRFSITSPNIKAIHRPYFRRKTSSPHSFRINRSTMRWCGFWCTTYWKSLNYTWFKKN